MQNQDIARLTSIYHWDLGRFLRKKLKLQNQDIARLTSIHHWDLGQYFLMDVVREQELRKSFRHLHLGNLSSEEHYQAGLDARSQGDDELAFDYLAHAIALTGHEPAKAEMRTMAQECFDRAFEMIGSGNVDVDILVLRDLLVRAVEMDPRDSKKREALSNLIATYADPDLTKKCFIFYDGERADSIHREAYRRAIEYVTIGGVPGDFLEFGVLGGWSSRIFCELMRDLGNYGHIHLFDSFEGLPEYYSAVDINSWEIGGRKIWADKMRFPDDFLKQFRSAHHEHIRTRLSELIRRERVFVHKGFYSETLKDNLPIKASVVHIDCDLYQSTVEVLWSLYRMDAFQDGSVLLFDDWNCNRASPKQGERLAFAEFLERQPRFSATPWYSYGYNGMAFHLHDANGFVSIQSDSQEFKI